MISSHCEWYKKWGGVNKTGMVFQKKRSQTQHLEISKTLERCYYEDAFNALNYVTTFLKYYFLNVSRLEPKQVRNYLLSLVCYKGGYIGHIEEPQRNILKKARDEWKLPIGYLLEE